MTAYCPSSSLSARLHRRITPFLARRMIPVRLDRPIVSFTFDDCPRSVIDYAIRPLETEHWTATLYIACGLLDQTNHHGAMMSAQDVKALHDAGHEIGCHSFSHIDAVQTTMAAFLSDLERNQNVLQQIGVSASTTFAYPFGQTSPAIKKYLGGHFAGLRGIEPGIMRHYADLNQIRSTPLYSGAAIENAIRQIADLSRMPGWLTFYTHDICDEPSAWGCTPDEFQQIISAVKSSGAHVLSMAKAITQLHKQCAQETTYAASA